MQIGFPGDDDVFKEVGHEHVETFDDAANIGRVELQSLLQLTQHADEVDDETDLLTLGRLIFIRAVNARNRLKQHVVAHRLVEVHTVEDRRVVARQQLVGNDHELGKLIRLLEELAGVFFLVSVG